MVNIRKPTLTKIEIKKYYDDNPNWSYLTDPTRYNDVKDPKERAKYEAEDKKRLDKVNSEYDNLFQLGIKAIGHLEVPIDENTTISQVITSGGLWGIESDSEPEYFVSVGNEQVEELLSIAKALNIEIPTNIKLEFLEPIFYIN